MKDQIRKENIRFFLLTVYVAVEIDPKVSLE
jgi:hypothetical protein